MDFTLNPIEEALVDEYTKIYQRNGIPDWAFKVNPPIPFVGNKIKKGHRVLVYGSAENLIYAFYPKKKLVDKPKIFNLSDEELFYRHKYFLRQWKNRCK